MDTLEEHNITNESTEAEKKNISSSSSSSHSQENESTQTDDLCWDFSTLVISGGGAKGLAVVAALQILDEHNCLAHITTFAGTSIGALICSLLAIGFSTDELAKHADDLDIQNLKQIDLWNFFYNFGLDTGVKIVKWIESMFELKGIDKNLTFLQLFDQHKKTLIITGTKVNEHKLEIFSYKTHPDCRIIDAIRISISIPFLFAAPKYENDYYSDGGILDNYPISCLHNYISSHDHILGIRITHSFAEQQRVDIFKWEFPKFAKHLVYTAINEINRLRKLLSEYETPYPNLVTIQINTENVGSDTLSLSDSDRKKLRSLGQYYTACWLDKAIETKRNTKIL